VIGAEETTETVVEETMEIGAAGTSETRVAEITVIGVQGIMVAIVVDETSEVAGGDTVTGSEVEEGGMTDTTIGAGTEMTGGAETGTAFADLNAPGACQISFSAICVTCNRESHLASLTMIEHDAYTLHHSFHCIRNPTSMGVCMLCNLAGFSLM
jgi:hypothetical protein